MDDFFENFPEARQVSIPFTVAELQEVIGGSLARCYNCLLYLNPKSNLYPLHLDQKGMSLGKLGELTARLTEEERKSLSDYGRRRGYFVPDETGLGILGLMDSVRCNAELMLELFPSHPSFAFIAAVTCNKKVLHPWKLGRYLLDWDFSKDADDLLFDEKEIVEALSQVVTALHIFCKTTEEVLRIARIFVPSFNSVSCVTPLLMPYDVNCATAEKKPLVVLESSLTVYLSIGGGGNESGAILLLLDELKLALHD